MSHYGWDEDKVRKRLVGAQGWVYYNWAQERERNIWGTGPVRKTPGYVAQERQRIYERRRQQ